MLYERFLEVSRAFNEEKVEYVLVDAGALSLHGIPRGTQDIDYFVRPTPENFARIRKALRRVWDDQAIAEITCDPPETIRYGTPDGFVVDLIMKLGEAFVYDDLEAEIVSVDGVGVRTATPRTLYEMKKSTVRPQDAADADRLRRKFNLA